MSSLHVSGAELRVKLPEGTPVLCTVQGLEFYVVIRGLAAVEQPFVGHTYIVQLNEPIQDYPYTCCAVPGVCLETVPQVEETAERPQYTPG